MIELRGYKAKWGSVAYIFQFWKYFALSNGDGIVDFTKNNLLKNKLNSKKSFVFCLLSLDFFYLCKLIKIRNNFKDI